MNPSSACLSVIQEFTGCAKRRPDGSFEAYPDPRTAGATWAIGWETSGLDVRQGTVWAQKQCDDRLSQEIGQLAQGVSTVIGSARTTQHQFDAMVSFAFQVGLGNFAASTLVKKHKAGDYAGACVEFARWNKEAGKVNPRLTMRREREAALYSS